MSTFAPPHDLEAAPEATAAPNQRGGTQTHNSSSSKIPDGGVDPEGTNDGNTSTKYGDTSATYWKLYGSESETSDKKYVESLSSDTESMVFLSSLFSSIVASFIIEIYKILLPDRGQQTVDLLSQLVSQSRSSQSPSQSPSPTNSTDQPFNPPGIAIRINVVLFLSFFLSIISAVSCALIRQWCDEYMKYAYPRAAPHECGRIRTYLFEGLQRFQMRRFMYGTHVLLHISVFLFLWAISDFFYMVHSHLGDVSRYCLVASLVVYMGLSISPLISRNSPYNTPLTHPLGACAMRLVYGFRIVQWYLRRKTGSPPDIKSTRFNRTRLILHEAMNRAAHLERYALEWLFTEDDFSDRDMDKFLEGLPGYMSSYHTEEDQLDNIISNHILERIKEHFLTCTTSSDLSEEERIARVLCCIESIQLIFLKSHPPNPSDSNEEELKQHRSYIEAIIDYLQTLCDRGKEDPIVALRASCVRGLAFHSLLAQIAQSQTDSASDRPYPVSLIPLHTHFFQGDTEAEGAAQQPDASGQIREDNDMWTELLSDGPLINLTILAEAIHAGELAPPESLSLCWKTFDMLVMQLGIARTEVSINTLHRFNLVHDRTREYVRNKNQGFRISPLLDVLDAVARGRRLSLAFSNHPEYHGRADVIFGREHLLNGDLLKAFACSLPDYIASTTPDERQKFMEDIVCKDDLWASLEVNLWNAQRADLPTPDKARVFEDCCVVLDVAFSCLENSTKVDWRAPELGSLIQHFELFTTHFLQNSFMGRATSFRVHVIRARCCRALLAQFCSDVVRDGTIFFRSQWDVTSLARLFWTLGVGDGKDAEFWKSYINGGPVVEFSKKALQTMDQATRDGPLLIFCKLGRLATMAMPLRGSGLETKDLENVWELQRGMINDIRLPLSCASDNVWEKLRGLKMDVNNLRVKMLGEDNDNLGLRVLLENIDAVLCNSKELGSSKSAEEQGPVTLTRHILKQRNNVKRSSFDSEVTVVTGGRYGSIAIAGGEDNFGTDKAPDPERNTHALPSSNDDDAVSFGFPSPHTIIQSVPAGGIIDPMLCATPISVSPVDSYFPYTDDTGQHRTTPHYPPFRKSSSGPTITRPSPTTRAGTSPPTKSSRILSIIPPSPAMGPLHGTSNLSGPGHFGAGPSSDFGVGEGE